MIRTLILYYLSLKSTHGYEIQKFIQTNHMDSWTKIQSGSIYYALSKLEKEGAITLQREEKVGSKVRKVYAITDKGKEELVISIKEELNREIYDVGSDKFIIYPILQGVDKKTIIEQVEKHIIKLRKQKEAQEKWQRLKIGEDSLKIERLCFQMMISNIEYQIKWHEALLEEIDTCIAASKQMASLIKRIDFSMVNDLNEIEQETQVDQITKLKQEILNHPDQAEEKLEQLVQLLKNGK